MLCSAHTARVLPPPWTSLKIPIIFPSLNRLRKQAALEFHQSESKSRVVVLRGRVHACREVVGVRNYEEAMDQETKGVVLLGSLFLRPLRGSRGWVVYLLILGLLGLVYFSLAGRIVAQINLDPEAYDQGANILLAQQSSADWYPHRSSYIQPLWPWLSRVVMDGDPGTYFTRGRWLNLTLGYVLTVALAVLAARWMAPVPGLVVGWLAGIGVMLQRSHFFHPEPLLYVLFAATVVLMALTLWHSRWVWYAGWGTCFGLAYLAKASTGPLLAVYAGATAVLLLARAGWCPGWLVARCDDSRWSLGRHAAGALLAVAIAGTIIAPNAVFKHRVHGDAFHQLPNYWMWCDDFHTEAALLSPRLETAEGRTSFAPGELPSSGNYVRKHGWAHAGERFREGFVFMTERFVIPVRQVNRALTGDLQSGRADRGEAAEVWRYTMPARGLYLCWLVGLAAVLLGWRTWREGSPAFRSATGLSVTALVTAMVLLYLAASGWYAAIGRGERFTLVLYLPLLLFASWGSWSLARASKERWVRIFYMAAVVVVLGHAMLQAAWLLRHPWFGAAL
jgi:hypothetical protein